MWSMLGQRGVTALAWESFGAGWVTDAQKQLKLADLDVLSAPYGDLPDLGARRFFARYPVHIERHDIGCARSQLRLDTG